jgi:cell division protein FtsN
MEKVVKDNKKSLEIPSSNKDGNGNPPQNNDTSDSVAEEIRRKKVLEDESEENKENDNNDDDDEYEETLIYVELSDFMGHPYLLNHAKKIVLKDVGSSNTPTMVVDGTEFKGTHTINLGSNHFYSSSSDASSSTPVYEGHSIKKTEFTLSRIHIPDKN